MNNPQAACVAGAVIRAIVPCGHCINSPAFMQSQRMEQRLAYSSKFLSIKQLIIIQP